MTRPTVFADGSTDFLGDAKLEQEAEDRKLDKSGIWAELAVMFEDGANRTVQMKSMEQHTLLCPMCKGRGRIVEK